jgi:hypothetical protein
MRLPIDARPMRKPMLGVNVLCAKCAASSVISGGFVCQPVGIGLRPTEAMKPAARQVSTLPHGRLCVDQEIKLPRDEFRS